jgi:hypothetical protein
LVEVLIMYKTTFVLVTDRNYFDKAKITINDLTTAGKWDGSIVLITLDFDLEEDYKTSKNIIEKKFPAIDKSHLIKEIGPDGFPASDKRELFKLNQWEKLHVFDTYFLQWDRVVFLDAGLRVLDDVSCLLELDFKNKILAPIDGKQMVDSDEFIFRNQLDHSNTENINRVIDDFGENIFNQKYMLNCMWVYDTSILHVCNKDELIDAMNRYPVCRTNEMGIMNFIFHLKHHLWEKFPVTASNGKYLFEWCESNNIYYTTWRDYCFLKYPLTIGYHETP